MSKAVYAPNPDMPSLTRAEVERHHARAVAEMAYLTLDAKAVDAQHVQAALALGQQILEYAERGCG